MVAQIVDIPVPQVVEELVEVFKVFFQDRVQQRIVEQIIETPAISLVEKIVKVPKNPYAAASRENVCPARGQHSGGGGKIIKRTVQRKKPIIQEKINQVTMNVEIPQLQYIDKVVDVPVVMQKQVPAIQKVQKTVEVPQVQLIDKVVDMLVVLQRHVTIIQKVQRTVEAPQVHYTDKIVDVPLVLQRQVPTIQNVQKTVEVQQVQFLDKVVDIPNVRQSSVPTIQRVQKTVEAPQVQFIDKVMDVPVVRQRQVPTEVHQKQFIDKVVDVPVIMQRQVPAVQVVQKPRKSHRFSSKIKWWTFQSCNSRDSTGAVPGQGCRRTRCGATPRAHGAEGAENSGGSAVAVQR